MGWSVMLFAAGFGTRMKHLTQDRPKPMIKVFGKPLIDHALELVNDLLDAKTVVNLHYKAEVLQDHLRDRSIETIVEHPKILDTGGGLRNALPHLGHAPVMTLNSDAVWSGSNPLKLAASNWDPNRMDGLMVCIPKKNTVGYKGVGNFSKDHVGRLTRGGDLVYGGAQIIKTDRLKEFAEDVFSLNLLWDIMIRENRLYGVEYDGKWCDVGHPEGISLAEEILEGRRV